jgi:hypothetical protein
MPDLDIVAVDLDRRQPRGALRGQGRLDDWLVM